MSVALSRAVRKGEKELSEVGHQHLRPALIVIHLLFTLRQQVDIHRREAALPNQWMLRVVNTNSLLRPICLARAAIRSSSTSPRDELR